MRIVDLLERDRLLYSSRPAVVVHGGETVSFEDLRARVVGLATALHGEGVERGDRVAIMAANGLTPFDTYLACAYLGAAAVPLSTRLTKPELGYIVDDAGPRLAIADPSFVETLSDAMPSGSNVLSSGTQTYRAFVESASSDDLLTRAQADDTALIIYTSGTTGNPKGVCLSQNALAFNGITMGLTQELTSRDVFMSMTPLYHAATGTRVSSMLVDGVCHVVLPAFDVDEALSAIEKYRVTTTIAVPTQLQRILDHPRRESYDLSSLRLLVYGAAPTGLNLVRRAMSELDCDLYQGYGLTEAVTNLTALVPRDHTLDASDERLSSAGRPVPGVTLSLREESGEVQSGSVGEICVRSDKVMTGYWRNPVATGEALRDGWLHTGDLGRMDAEGYITIVGRSKEMLISGGVNIYPAEIEAVLVAIDGIVEAAVVGMPDATYGEKPVACVIPEFGADLSIKHVIEVCRNNLASFKVPKEVWILVDFPRTSTGKVRKLALREQLMDSGST